jgi:hypothetical protein
MTPYKADSKFGPTLRAYVVYLLIEMRLSHERVSEHLSTVFDVRILGTMVNEIKRKMAQKYEPTYRAILAQLTDGAVVHADETKGVVYGGGHYVWITTKHATASAAARLRNVRRSSPAIVYRVSLKPQNSAECGGDAKEFMGKSSDHLRGAEQNHQNTDDGV